MNEIYLAAVAGAAAFAHCLGMCGGFVLQLAGGKTSVLLLRQGLWHAGRICTYVFLGGVAGFAGQMLSSILPAVQKPLAYVMGAVMIFSGLSLLGVFSRRRSDKGSGGLLAGMFRQLCSEQHPLGPLVLGLASGLLPCPIVVGFLAMSAYSASVLNGAAIMAAMGAGTIWSLGLLAVSGQVVRHWLRRWSLQLAAAMLILTGSATLARNTAMFHHLLGCGSSGASQAQVSPTFQPSCHSSGDGPTALPAAAETSTIDSPCSRCSHCSNHPATMPAR